MAAIALTPDDLDRYRALMLEGYTLHPDAFTSTAEERTNLPRSWWQARLQAGPIAESLAFGVIRGDELAGAAALLFESRTKTRHKATLVGMYVRDRYRGHGIGGELVASVLEAARAREGVLLVQLTVSEPNTAARRLYERHGFVQFGVEPLAMLGQCGYIAKCHMQRLTRLPQP
jgi:GNAT superfamily N-acetyltransferase